MEHVIIVNHIKDLKRVKPKYSRVYFGNEFCPRLLPDIKDLGKAIKIIKSTGRRFTLLTPYADSQGLEKMKKLFDYMAKRKRPTDEIAVNDWGVLYYLRRELPAYSVIVGRALTRCAFLNDFFKKMGANRMEFDYLNKRMREILSFKYNNPAQDLKMKLSYYYPYTVVQGTRYCPLANIAGDKRENPGIIPCFRECLKMGELRLRNNSFKKEIILKGNAQFMKQDGAFNPLDIKSIDRLVFQPRL